MDLADLALLLRVEECGSFTLAAQTLGLTQPGLSRRVQRLEHEVGVPLFVRTRTGVRLTPAGERYRAFAQDVLARHQQLMDELRGDTKPLVGELRIVASTTPADFVVPRLVADFTVRQPAVRAQVLTADSAAVATELLERRWDVGFTGARLGDARLDFRPIAADEVVLAVPAGHPFAARGAVALTELADERFIEREGGSGTLMSVRAALAARGLALPPHRVSMTLSTTQAIVSAVGAGYGVGFVSARALEGGGERGVMAVRLAGLPLHRELFLVCERGRVLPRVARRFAEFVLAANGRAADPPA